jgi:hypothetical protein
MMARRYCGCVGMALGLCPAVKNRSAPVWNSDMTAPRRLFKNMMVVVLSLGAYWMEKRLPLKPR